MRYILATFIIVIFYCTGSSAQSDSSGKKEWKSSSYLSGEWYGFRAELENEGIRPEIIYNFLPIANLKGGIKQGAVWMDNLDISLALDLQQLVKSKGTTVFLYALRNNGQLFTPYVGDLQVVSNIETTTKWQLYEAWIEQNFFSDRLSLLVGKYDLNAEFDFIRPGLLFLHSSFGIGVDYSQSGIAGPTVFPYTSLAGRLAWKPNSRFKLQAMVADAVPEYSDISIPDGRKEGLLTAFEIWFFHMPEKQEQKKEAAFRKPFSRRNRSGRAAVQNRTNHFTLGFWSYSSPFPEIGTEIEGEPFHNAGIYLSVQQYFYFGNDKNYLGAFLRAGLANSRYNRIGSSYTGGVQYSSMMGKMRLRYGIAFSHARNGNHFLKYKERLSEPVLASETAIEATIASSVLPGVVLQPNLQWIINPGTDPALSDALVFGVLTEIAF